MLNDLTSSIDDAAPSADGVSPMPAALLASSAFLVPLALSASTSPTPNHPRTFLWYRFLRKPGIKPPDAAIPVAWTLIESSLAYAGYRLLRTRPSASRNRALGWLGINILAIGGWSRLFFGGRNLPVSTTAAVSMIGGGAAYVAEARKVDRKAAIAGVPFVAWVAFAAVLTGAIWRLNR